jgi:Methyltransferase domain
MIPNRSRAPIRNGSELPATPGHCPICTGSRRERFQARLLGKYNVCYFYCDSCGLLQTEEPYWLDEAYSIAIADTDTGLVSRNLDLADRVACLLYFCFDPGARYLEFAGGYGLLTRLLRDKGFDFYWHDPYCQNVFARGFEWDPLKGTSSCHAVTAFEVIEHVWDPAAFIRNALEVAHAKTIIFSTLLYEGEPPSPEEWWYYSLSTGQHISFFRRETLLTLANKLGLHFHSHGSFQVMTAEKVHPVAFRWCTSRLARLAGTYMAFQMRSKTFDDHRIIVDRRGSSKTS